LGIGEDCIKDTGDCTGYHNYAKGTTFPKSIYRVGAEFAALPTAVSTIIDTFANTITDSDDKAKFLATVSKEIRIAQSGTQNPSGGVWTISANDAIANAMKLIAHPTSNHLGIDESACLGSDRTGADKCGLQDYRTAEQKATFPKEINRYGKKTNYTDAELSKGVADIISIFSQIKANLEQQSGYYDAVMEEIDKLCVSQSSGTNALNTNYTWNKTLKILGVDPDATATDIGWLVGRLPRLHPSDGRGIDEVAPAGNLLTQLQPASNIRMAKGSATQSDRH